jgi:hypothetical protein
MKAEYNSVFDNTVSRLRYMDERLISIDYPTERSIDSVASALRAHHGEDDVLIINMSERVYDYDRMPGHVVSVNFRGLPAPPLEMLCRLCLQMHQWLSRSPKTVVAMHCFPGYSRTAVLASCYLAWSGKNVHPIDALGSVCASLGISDDAIESMILPSQKRYMNYFFEFLISDDESLIKVPPQQLQFSRLMLTGLPKLPPMGEDSDGFRPFFEIWQNGKLIFSSLPTDIESLPVYPASDDSVIVSIDVPGAVVVCGDVLVRIRHYTQKGGRFTCLRFAFSTNQIRDNSLHLSQHEIDGNRESNCMINVVFSNSVNVEDSTNTEAHRHIFQAAKKISEKLRSGLFEGQTVDEESMLMNALRATEEHEEAPVVDDVDDFFAQLEKDARID